MDLYDVRLKTASSITIAGPSQAGKTTLVEKIVQKRDKLFTEPFAQVYWFCSYPPSRKLEGVQYHVGTPTNMMNEIVPHSLVIIDDFMKELSNSNELTSLMTKSVHHLPMTLINIVQNIFHKGSDSKTRRLNTNYLVVFKNPHDKMQIDIIGRQMYPKDKHFLSASFIDATKKPYSYLFIDCHQTTPDAIRVRSNITAAGLEEEEVMKVYVPSSILTSA